MSIDRSKIVTARLFHYEVARDYTMDEYLRAKNNLPPRLSFFTPINTATQLKTACSLRYDIVKYVKDFENPIKLILDQSGKVILIEKTVFADKIRFCKLVEYTLEDYIEAANIIYDEKKANEFLLTHSGWLGGTPLEMFATRPTMCVEHLIPRLEWGY